MDPLNLEIMDVNAKIRSENLLEVTSTFIRESSSTEFHRDGLYSERIFGEVASPERIARLGYINLRTPVFHPRVYKIITRLKGFYEEVLSGKAYAIFDQDSKDFIRADEGDAGAQTGYVFFLKYFPQLRFTQSESITRKTKLQVLSKYKDRLLMTKCIVLPAGLRDMKNTDGRDESDEINKIYSAIINLARAMPMDGSDHAIYDSLRFAIQMKILQVYEYLHEMISDKNGFLQAKYGARAISLGTRNVISSASMAMPSPSSPQYLKSDETLMPLYQCMKGYQPLVIYHLKYLFLNTIFNDGAAQVSLIDQKTLALTYVEVGVTEKDKFLTSDGLVDFISSYRDPSTRHHPVVVKGVDGKHYYMVLIYKDGKNIYMTRSARDLKGQLEAAGSKFVPAQLRPITRAEMFYLATFYATQGKHVTVTRYPITSQRSIYPSKVHLASTTPSEEIHFNSFHHPGESIVLPHWPVMEAPSVDSSSPHPAHLVNLGGDFDGDTVSNNPILTEEANAECTAHLSSPGFAVGVNGKLDVGLSTDIARLTIFNLTREASLK